MGRECGSLKTAILVGLAVLLFGSVPAFAQKRAFLEISSGKAQVMRQGKDIWELAQEKKTELFIGDRVRTSSRSEAVIALEDGSKIELGPSSIFVVDFLKEDDQKFSLKLGRIKAFVSKIFQRKFAVLTPTAVMAVRGTEFTVQVDDGGVSKVELLEGLLAVSDTKGNEVLLQPGQKIEITQEAMGTPQGEAQTSSADKKLKDLASREVSRDMSKEEVQAAAALELRLAEYQLGKTMIDAFGKRVRVEEYVFKPAANQAKFVVLNEREDRFDYFFYTGTFNKDLPVDVGQALLQLGGGLSLPEYYLTSFESYRSNTVDNMRETASGGHLVDLGPAGTNEVTSALDLATGKAAGLGADDHYYKTFYDDYTLSINGISKIYLDTSALSLAGAGDFQGRVQSLAHEDASWRYAGDGVFTQVKGPSDYSGDMHFTIDNTFNDGTFLKYDTYMVEDDGNVLKAADFANVTTGATMREKMLSWNYEEVITATEFGGRKIDLVVDPKLFIQMGQVNAN